MTGSEIICLPDILPEVVESVLVTATCSVVEGPDQFPVQVMHCHGGRKPLRRVTVTGDVGEHRSTIPLPTAQDVRKINAIDDVPLGSQRSTSGEWWDTGRWTG